MLVSHTYLYDMMSAFLSHSIVHQQNLVASDPCVSQSDSENTAPSCPNACRCISIVLLIVLAGTLTPFCIPSNLPWPFTSIWIHDVFLNGLPMLWFKDNRDLSTVTGMSACLHHCIRCHAHDVYCMCTNFQGMCILQMLLA